MLRRPLVKPDAVPGIAARNDLVEVGQVHRKVTASAAVGVLVIERIFRRPPIPRRCWCLRWRDDRRVMVAGRC